MVKVWSSAMDGCGCSLCARLEGTAVPLNEPFVITGRSVQEPPLHDGCRCALIYDESPKPASFRDFEAFRCFAGLANDSEDFFAAMSGYHAAVFFLRRLAERSDAELEAAGLAVRRSLSSDLASLVANRDGVVNGAILRSFDWWVRNFALENKGAFTGNSVASGDE